MRVPKNKSHFAAACILVIALVYAAGAQAKVIERIAAVVNGDIITQSDINQYDDAVIDFELRPGAAISQATERRRVLDDLIDETLLKQAVEKSDITVTDEELSRAIRNVLAQNRMTLAQLRDELARKGMTYDEYKDQLKLEIKKIKFINQVISPDVKITDRDLRDYFQRHKATLYGGTEVHIAEIVLPTAGITSQEEAYALRDRAISITRQSRENKRAFARLAKQYSEGPNADKGGDLGTVQIGDLPDRVAAMVKRMPEGTVSDPLPTDTGIVIVKVIDWPTISEGDFKAVRDSIYQKVYEVRLQEATDAYVQRMRQRSYIEIR